MAVIPRHLLILTYYFPPSRAAGAQRIQNIVDVALEKGWKVSVITLDEGQKARSSLVAPKKIIDEQRLHIYKLKHYVGLQNKTKANAGLALSEKKLFRGAAWIFCQKLLLALNTRVIRYRFEKVAKRIITTDTPTIMLSSAPPFIVHEVALKLKKVFPAIFWQADFRDPWVYPGSIHSIDDLPEKMGFKKVLLKADGLIAVTSGHHEFLQVLSAQASKPPGRVVLAPNGTRSDLYDEVSTRHVPENRAINIGHLGDITYTHRNPKSLIYALTNVSENFGEVALHFWAEVTPYTRWNGESLKSIIDSANLAQHLLVSVSSYVSRAEALEYQKSLDLLVIFAIEQPFQIPSKAYEYLVSDKPILAICDKGGETYKLLRQFEGVFIATENTVDEVSVHLKGALTFVKTLKKEGVDIKVNRNNLQLLDHTACFESILKGMEHNKL